MNDPRLPLQVALAAALAISNRLTVHNLDEAGLNSGIHDQLREARMLPLDALVVDISASSQKAAIAVTNARSRSTGTSISATGGGPGSGG
jgi:hypothetical protein